MLTRYESRLRRIHKQAHAMLLRLRQERPSEPALPEPALPEPPPAPVPTPDLAQPPDGPEVCAPQPPATPPPAVPVQQIPDGVIPLTPKPEARCSHETKSWQNEPPVQRLLPRFRSRRERKTFDAGTLTRPRRMQSCPPASIFPDTFPGHSGRTTAASSAKMDVSMLVMSAARHPHHHGHHFRVRVDF